MEINSYFLVKWVTDFKYYTKSLKIYFEVEEIIYNKQETRKKNFILQSLVRVYL